MIRVVVCKVGQEPAIAEIEETLPAIQDLVGGFIEVCNIGKNLALVCNEEAAIRGLPPNRCGILGDFFFMRHDPEGDGTSLTDNDIEEIVAYCARHKGRRYNGRVVTLQAQEPTDVVLKTIIAGGKLYGAGACLVTVGGHPTSAIAVRADNQQQVTTIPGAIDWLVARTLEEPGHGPGERCPQLMG